MTLDDWIEATKGLLDKCSGEPFSPVIADPVTHTIRALQGIPHDVSPTIALQDWMLDLALEEVFFAVPESSQAVILGHRKPDGVSFAKLEHKDGAWVSSELSAPTWWRN